SPGDASRLRSFATDGGRVLLAANAFFVGSVPAANTLLADCGMNLIDTESLAPNATVLDEKSFSAEIKERGIKTLSFRRASPITISNKEKATILVQAHGFRAESLGFVASAKVGKGQFIALGQSLWWSWISDNHAKASDNAKLLSWLLAPPPAPPEVVP